jgi:hypothetical protein
MGGAAALVWIALAQTGAQPNSQPNPYRTVEGWFHLPEGRSMGSTSAVDVDPQGHNWVAERCGVSSCAGSTLAPVLEFEPSGRLLKKLGRWNFYLPAWYCHRPGGKYLDYRRPGKGRQRAPGFQV